MVGSGPWLLGLWPAEPAAQKPMKMESIISAFCLDNEHMNTVRVKVLLEHKERPEHTLGAYSLVPYSTPFFRVNELCQGKE